MVLREGGGRMALESVQGVRPFYRDIAERTQGDLYIGVVGPVRTGKSTFISNFMEQMVLPFMAESPRRERLTDELPQSGSGKTIMTTQPKFVPGEGAAEIKLDPRTNVRVRMVDSVGYLIPGALGTQEGEAARMVSTPWAEEDLPFEEAAALGTKKVISDHATVGVVVTTDGTVAELPRSNYVPAEEQVIRQLKALQKPFAVVLNSAHPESGEAKALRASLESKYDVAVTLLNVKEMSAEDAQQLLSGLLLEFPLREVRFTVPAWMGALEETHWLPAHALKIIRDLGDTLHKVRDKEDVVGAFGESEYLQAPRETEVDLGEGAVLFDLPVKEGLFNQILSEQCGETITGDAHLLSLMKELVAAARTHAPGQPLRRKAESLRAHAAPHPQRHRNGNRARAGHPGAERSLRGNPERAVRKGPAQLMGNELLRQEPERTDPGGRQRQAEPPAHRNPGKGAGRPDQDAQRGRGRDDYDFAVMGR